MTWIDEVRKEHEDRAAAMRPSKSVPPTSKPTPVPKVVPPSKPEPRSRGIGTTLLRKVGPFTTLTWIIVGLVVVFLISMLALSKKSSPATPQEVNNDKSANPCLLVACNTPQPGQGNPSLLVGGGSTQQPLSTPTLSAVLPTQGAASDVFCNLTYPGYDNAKIKYGSLNVRGLNPGNLYNYLGIEYYVQCRLFDVPTAAQMVLNNQGEWHCIYLTDSIPLDQENAWKADAQIQVPITIHRHDYLTCTGGK